MPDIHDTSLLKPLLPREDRSLDWLEIVCCACAFILFLLPAFYCFALLLHGLSFTSALDFLDIDYSLRSQASMKWGWFIPWMLESADNWLPIEFFGTLLVNLVSLGTLLRANKTSRRILVSSALLLSISSGIFCIIFFMAALQHMKPLHFV